MRKPIILILSIAVLASVTRADDDAGYAGAFMRNGVGARPLGMGGAFTAVADGPEATYYNPAGLGFATKVGTSLSYKTLSLDRHLGHIAVSFPIRNEATMAASWINSGVSNVPSRGQSRQVEGDIGNNQNAFSLSFAKAIEDKFSVGGSIRYLQEKLDALDVFAIGVDAGFLVRFKNIGSIGGTVQNLGSTYRWDSSNYWSQGTAYDDKFPVIARLGLAGDLLSGTLIPSVDLEKSNKMGVRVRAGGEYWFVKKVTHRVEDEYEEGKFNEVVENVRWAGLRIGIDNGSPTFGASYAYPFMKTSLALEYAYLVGREGTSAGHIFTLKLGL